MTKVYERRRVMFGVLVACGLSAAATAPLQAQGAAPANSGEALYQTNCGACHGARLEGTQNGPTLSADAFVAAWAGKGDLLAEQLRATMPPANPGALSAENYRAIARFIQARAGAPAGDMKTAAAPPPAPPSGAGANRDAVFQASQRARQQKLDALAPVTDQMISAPAGDDWLSYRGSASRQSFSTLDLVNRRTVRGLTLAWSWSLPMGRNQIEPLVHDGVMFIQSGHEIQALDAVTGRLLWRYRRDVDQKFGLGPHRAMALSGSRLFAATSDGNVVALDVKTGAVLWDTVVTPGTNAVMTAGPIVARGTVIQGTANGPVCSARCAIVGLDAATGKEKWRFKTTATKDDPNGDTWNGAPPEERTGGGSWIAGSYDAKTGLAYIGTGQTYFVAPLMRPLAGPAAKNNALYINSTLALDPETGRLAWFHQHLPRDIWNYDEAYERTLVSVPVDGKPRDAIATMGKLAIVDVLDRSSGKPIFSFDLGLQTVVDSIDPDTGYRHVRPELTQPEPGKVYAVCPGSMGLRLWYATAYDPGRNVIYLPLHENCGTYRWNKTETMIPRDIVNSSNPRPGNDGNFGRLVALDLKSRKVLWMNRERPAIAGSLLATAGGVVFSGNADRVFRALDSDTGKTLWSTTLNALPGSSPITYRAGGTQYVAVVAGSDLMQASIGAMTPEIDRGAETITLWVFKL